MCTSVSVGVTLKMHCTSRLCDGAVADTSQVSPRSPSFPDPTSSHCVKSLAPNSQPRPPDVGDLDTATPNVYENNIDMITVLGNTLSDSSILAKRKATYLSDGTHSSQSCMQDTASHFSSSGRVPDPGQSIQDTEASLRPDLASSSGVTDLDADVSDLNRVNSSNLDESNSFRITSFASDLDEEINADFVGCNHDIAGPFAYQPMEDSCAHELKDTLSSEDEATHEGHKIVGFQLPGHTISQYSAPVNFPSPTQDLTPPLHYISDASPFVISIDTEIAPCSLPFLCVAGENEMNVASSAGDLVPDHFLVPTLPSTPCSDVFGASATPRNSNRNRGSGQLSGVSFPMENSNVQSFNAATSQQELDTEIFMDTTILP